MMMESKKTVMLIQTLLGNLEAKYSLHYNQLVVKIILWLNEKLDT